MHTVRGKYCKPDDPPEQLALQVVGLVGTVVQACERRDAGRTIGDLSPVRRGRRRGSLDEAALYFLLTQLTLARESAEVTRR